MTTNNTFGLGYEELDEKGNPVPGTQRAVTRFDPAKNTVCLPLVPGPKPVHETWELDQFRPKTTTSTCTRPGSV